MSAAPNGYQTGSQQSPQALQPPVLSDTPGRIGGVTEIPDWLSTTLAADAAGIDAALPAWIRALSPDVRIAGPALVVQVAADDNQPMRDVPAAVAAPGTVLVVAGAVDSRTAILGDLVARELLAAGVIGVVTDGLIRDSREVAALGLPVWGRGTTPVASAKRGPGSVGGAVDVGGIAVSDGDLVVADADGVVVWRSDDIPKLLVAAEAKQQADDERLAALSSSTD
jgi:4-hydroxy-4-methyl-2-oxoglutarate aldolase